MGFGVSGLGFRVWGLGFRVSGLHDGGMTWVFNVIDALKVHMPTRSQVLKPCKVLLAS